VYSFCDVIYILIISIRINSLLVETRDKLTLHALILYWSRARHWATHEAGSLEVLALDKAPPYYALSHSWGVEDQPVAIQIDGQTLYVAFDLAVAIRRFQDLAAGDSELEPPIKYL
jgi:hypothetical protein